MVPTVRLSHGAEMPRLGLGTWPMTDDEAEVAVAEATAAGYRLFDTAENYGNEAGVGRGLRASVVPREEFFVTTKFNAEWHGADLVRRAFEASASRLGVEYIDLMLIHWPNPWQGRYIDAWRGLIHLREEGLVRAIGVSNFKPAHLDRIVAETRVIPEVNQVELSPTIARPEIRAYDERRGIVTESWSPIEQGGAILQHPLVTDLARRHARTPAQVVLRWHIELGLVTIPKTSNAARMRENIAIFDFSLAPADIAALTALDRGESAATDSDQFGH